MSFCSIDLESPKVKEFINSLSDLGESEARIKNLINLWRNKTRKYDDLPSKEDLVNLIIDQFGADNTKELKDIAKKAIDNNTLRKINDKESNLNLHQWLQVRTKAFKEWFGDWENDSQNASKVVDENGEPLVVYHGGARDITEFRTSTENASNTGYGFYTDKQTGEKIPVDSARAVFFSSNKHVAKSYAQLYALQYFKELRIKTQSAISTFYEGKASIEKDIFKTVDEFYDFLIIVSDFNPRFKKLRDYLKDIKSRGQKIKPNEVEEARKLFIELRSNLDEYTKDWNLNSSSWENVLEVGANIINEYNSKEGIKKLKNGEIPKYVKKEWELYNKIQNHRKEHGLPEIGNYQEVFIWLSSSPDINGSDYSLIYNGKELLLDNTKEQREIPISKLSNKQIEEFFNKAEVANTKSIEDRKKINTNIENEYSKVSNTYEVFLNIRNPLIHDYEGTHMGQGYKQSPKNSFGYVAARQVNKAIKEGYDGVVYENIYDPYLANNYGVFNSNQIQIITQTKPLNQESIKTLQILNIKQNEYTKEFKELQKRSRSLSIKDVQEFHNSGRTDEFKRRLGSIYERLLSRSNSSRTAFWTSLKHNTAEFSFAKVNGQLFHDIFEINRQYLKNGELVDLHDNYDDCKCYLSNDGLCGFAIEQNGNLISVFSLNPSNKKGFLYAIKEFIIENGATHLDAYVSNSQNLETIYEKTLGFKTASRMHYDMSYDHDNIGTTHGMPDIVFMVNNTEVIEKVFDEYEDAVNYQKANVLNSKIRIEEIIKINSDLQNKNKEEIIPVTDKNEHLRQSFKTSQQRQDRVLLISRLFSQIVNKQVGSNADTKTRDTYKLNNALTILNTIKNQLLHPSSIKDNDANKEYKTIEFQKIQDNWDLLLEEVADQLAISEGLKLDFIEKKASDNVEFNDDNEDATNEGDSSDNEDTEVVYKDGWMIKARLIPLRDSLSKEVRKVISEIPKKNKLGEYEKDDLGYYRNLSADYVHTVLLDTLSKITNSNDFFPALNDLAKSKIWVEEIIKKLQGDEKLQALFYRDLVKEFVPYWIEYTTENNNIITYKTKQVNKSASHYYLLNDWRDNFESGTRFTENSVYDNFGKIVPKNGTVGKERVEKFKEHIRKQTNPTEYLTKDSTINSVEELLNSVGISVTKDEILEYIGLNLGKSAEYAPLENLLDNLYNIFKGVSEVLEDKVETYDLLNENNSAYSNIAKQMNIIPQGAIIPNFKEAGKSYQSYSPQSYMGRLLNKIKYSTEQQFKEFIENDYGQYSFFKTLSKGKERWWNDWLSKMVSDKKYRNLFDRKVVLTSDKKEFDNQDEKYYMRSILAEYFSGGKEDAWYYCPLLADAPSSEFFKFIKYVDGMVVDGIIIDDYKDYIADKMTDTVLQEIQRINLVINRYNNKNIQPIANFDIVEGQPNAANFKFFPALNEYQIEGINFLNYINGRIKEGKNVRSVIKNVIKEIQNTEFDKYISTITQQGVLEKLNYTNTQLENFFWNNAHAQTQIIEILTTDLGFYKNLNDFQKRFKEVYAQTQRLYTNITGGKTNQRVLYLVDQEITSVSYREVEELLKDYYKDDKESLNKILSKFKEVNVTDAQAYRPLSSYRDIMRMSGQWTEELEKAYNNFINNTYKPEDFNVVLQTIKPFVFTQIGVPSGLGDGKNIKMPTQHKNSESVLLSIYEVIAGPNNTSSKLKAIHQFMEDRKIDVVMFNSAVKAGCQGPIDLNSIEDGDYDGTYQTLVDNALIDGLDNPEVIHTYPTEDYGIQVETPEHMYDSESLIGSQLRKLIMADLPEKYTLKVGNKKFKSREELWKHYNAIMTSLFEEGFKEVYSELSTKEGVERLLQKQMKGNSRYTDEMRKACTLTTDEHGNVDFVTPLFDPIQSERIENLLCSIVKTAVVKQKTKGAKAIQVSNFGYHKDLMLRFKDQNNNLIFTENEWNGDTKGLTKQEVKLLNKLKSQYNNSYINYRNSAKSTSVAYYEAYLPAYTRDLFGNINTIEGTHEINIDDVPAELRECIGYRIPTENKLSMQPIRIKGFLPHQEGAKIALPADITTIVGADFDVDGIFLMLPETKVSKYDKAAAREAFRMSNESFESTNEDFENWYKEHKNEFKYNTPIIKRISYDYTKSASQNTTEQKANGLIDLFYSILTSKEVAPQILKPGNFDEASRVGKICDLLKEVSYYDLAKELGVTTKELPNTLSKTPITTVKKLLAKHTKTLNPLNPTTQTYFHNQNAVGGKMIGMYANSSVHNALSQYTNFSLTKPLKFLGTTYQSLNSQIGKYNQRISDNIGQFSAASVDNVKDPTLSSLNQNTFTGNISSLLLRLGVPIFEVGVFMNQPVVKEITTAVLNKPNNITINQVLSTIKKSYLNTLGVEKIEQLKIPTVTIEDLLQNISTTKTSNYDLKQLAVLELFEQLYNLGTQLGDIVRNNRGDTSNGSVDSTVLSNIAREQELIYLKTPDFIYENIVNSSSLTDDALDLYDGNYKDISDIPMLNIATIAGIGGVNAIMQQYFPQNNTQIQSMFEELSKVVGTLNRYNTKVYDRAYKDYMTYWLAELSSLNKTTINSTTYYGKDLINYFFNSFPKEFTTIKNSIEELKNNNFIKNIIEDNRNLPITILKFKNTGNLSKQMKEAYSKDWEMLLNSPNEVIRNLGITLFQYCLYIGGLYYNGQTFIHLAPLSIRQQIEGYNSRLKELMVRDDLTYEFVNQFALNHLYNNTVCPECAEASAYFNSVENGDSLSLDISNETVKNSIKATSFKNAGVIEYSPKEYIKIPYGDSYRYWKLQSREDVTNSIVTYNEVYPLGYRGKLVEYLPGVEFFETSIPKDAKVNNTSDSTSESSEIEEVEISWEVQTTDADLGLPESYVPNENFKDANNQNICD